MSRYIMVFTGGGMPETEEEQAKVLAEWGAWYGKLGAAVADPGNPFGASKNIVPGGAVSDGAYGTPASGFVIVNADSMDAAVAMGQSCPMLDGNGQITIYEGMEM